MKIAACVLAMFGFGLVSVRADDAVVGATLLLNDQKKTDEEWMGLLTKGLTVEEVKGIVGEPTSTWPRDGESKLNYNSVLVEPEVPANSMRTGFSVHFEDGGVDKVEPITVQLGRKTKLYDRRGKGHKELEIIEPPIKTLEKGVPSFLEEVRVQVFELGKTGKVELDILIMQMDSFHKGAKEAADLEIVADCELAQLIKLNYPDHADWLADGKLNLSKALVAIEKRWEEEARKNEKPGVPVNLEKAAAFELRLVLKEGAEGEGIMKKKSAAGDVLTLGKAKGIGSRDIKTAFTYRDQDRWPINIRLTEEGAKKFGELTEKAVGERLAILLDGKLVTTPVINEPILGGTLQITGNFTEKEARELVKLILGSE